jgi:hypothetical protein
MMPPLVPPAFRAVRSRVTDRFRRWVLVLAFLIAASLVEVNGWAVLEARLVPYRGNA